MSELAVRRGGWWQNKWAGHVIEPLVLALGMFVLAAWIAPGVVLSLTGAPGDGCGPASVEGILAGGVFFGLLSMPVLLLVRYVPNRLIVVAGSVAWVVGVSVWLYVVKMLPGVREIREADSFHLFDDMVLLDPWHIAMRIWLWAVVSVLGGFYAARRRFSYLRLIAGVLATGYLSMFLFTPFASWPRWWLAPVCFAVFAALLVSLPIQRAALERLIGIRLGHGTAAEPFVYSPVGALAAHLALVLMGVGVAASAAINYYERALVDILTQGPRPTWHSPAERNAYDSMKTHFTKGNETNALTGENHPADYEDALKLTAPLSTGTREHIFSAMDTEAIKAYIAELGEHITLLEEASRADYLQMPAAQFPSFLNLREAARAIAIRSQLALRAGDADAAVNDVATLWRMGGLLGEQPTLVSQMIGVAIRNMATQAAWSLLAVGVDNRELIDALTTALNDNAGENRDSLDFRAMQDGEPGMLRGAISPAVSITVPAFRRAHSNGLNAWANFDLLQIGTALERFRLDRGVYPQQLQELVPNYLERIPVEPVEGRAYGYVVVSDERYDLFDPRDREGTRESFDTMPMLPMPPQFAEDPEEQKRSTPAARPQF